MKIIICTDDFFKTVSLRFDIFETFILIIEFVELSGSCQMIMFNNFPVLIMLCDFIIV